ncbi:MAG TPA: HAMP domain-containing sensor histidine kinase [Polyangiaceae bacterium]|nr:HAMP domain-containing sensor histidine kinase [Polyangiaceae bacterium]
MRWRVARTKIRAAPSGAERALRGLTPILIGAGAGAAYAAILRLIDRAWPIEHPGHLLLDWTIPVVLGVVWGALVATGRARAEKQRAERRAIEQLRERIKGTEREQAVWVLASSLLHELRNPLHTLGLALDELARADPPASQEKLLAEARHAVERMNERFRRLRSLADQPDRRHAPYDLAELVRSRAAQFDVIARANGASVRVSGPASLTVVGDEIMTRTSVESLISNATDAVGAGGCVDVALESEGDRAIVRVCDDGPGIPETLRAHAFQPLHTTKAPQHGLGLGLPIARGLARAQDGDVVFEDRARGACVVLSLPLCAQATEGAP